MDQSIEKDYRKSAGDDVVMVGEDYWSALKTRAGNCIIYFLVLLKLHNLGILHGTGM